MTSTDLKISAFLHSSALYISYELWKWIDFYPFTPIIETYGAKLHIHEQKAKEENNAVSLSMRSR